MPLTLVIVDDFTVICRTCLKRGTLYPIHGTQVANIQVTELLSFSVNVDFQMDDMLPQHICDDCLNDLYRVGEFKKRCLENERALKSIQNIQSTGKSNDTEEEYDLEDVKPDILELPLTATSLQAESTDQVVIPEVASSIIRSLRDDTNDTTNARKVRKKVIRKKQQCRFCMKMYDKSKLREHMRVHTKEQPLTCDICCRSFNFLSSLKRHQLVHTRERRYTCPQCGKSFTRRNYLRIHEKNHEPGHKDNNLCVKNELSTCEVCGLVFKFERTYRNHLEKYHGDRKLQLKEPKNPYACDVCCRTYSTLAGLKQHKGIHGEKKFLCYYCGRRFLRSGNLNLHLTTHTGEKPFECKHCNKGFPDTGTLNAHLKYHLRQRRFECKFCQKKFFVSGHLKVHLRLHTGEKPYVCDFCGKKFALKVNMTVHTRIHTGEKPYVCSICDKGFYDSSTLKKHKKVHNPRSQLVKTEEISERFRNNEED